MESPDPHLSAFPERLKQAIGSLPIALTAEKSGVSEAIVRKYLKAESYPGLKNLLALAEVTGVNVGWLASGEGPMQGGLPSKADAPVGFLTPGDATVRIPIYDGLSAGEGLEAVGHILGYGDFFLDWIQNEARIDPKRAFVAPVRGDSMMTMLYDGDLVLGEVQDYIDRDGVFAASLNGNLVVKHASPGPRRGEITLSSENPRYAPRIVSEANGDELHVIGRIARRLTGLTSTPL